MPSFEALSILSFVLVSFASATGIVSQVEPALDYGTFQNPSSNLRPRFRYWIPDASVDPAQVAADVKDAGRIGGGGVEVLGYYNYGDDGPIQGPIPTDWTEYGWGTPAWRTIQDAALQAAKDSGLIIDLSLGPNQGAGVPAEYDDDGLQWDLQPFNVSVPIGSAFDGTLPGWGTGELVAAVSATVVKSTNTSTAVTKTLAESSLHDVTKQVSSSGHLTLQFPSQAGGETHILFAYYLVHTGFREQQTPSQVTPGVPQSPIITFVQNGSFVVDHFSARGAETVASFWQSHLLNGSNTAGLVREIGNYAWEDSQEFPANIWWTQSLPATFAANRGYSVAKYIPVLFNGNGRSQIGAATASSVLYITDEADSGESHNADYRQTLTELNAEYLKGLTNFANSIGIQSSAQVVYNLPMDMLANIPDVDAPECETLGFNHIIDDYRQFSGPANLAGKRVISSECGAISGQAYQQTIPELLWDVKRSIVGGVNNFVFHGYPYSGTYPNTTWPSYTTFDYLFSEMHNRHQPGWDFYKDFMDYTARMQWVAQSGVPKIDLAFLQKHTWYETVSTSYQPTDLQDDGYTYEYLSSDNFDLPAAVVQDGVLAPTAQAFKAIIVRANETVTPYAIDRLYAFAQQGLPVIFAGGLPTNVSCFSGTSDCSIESVLSQMTALLNVHTVSYDGLAQSVTGIGILPRVAVTSKSSQTDWYTLLRQSSDGSEAYVIVYNDATGTPLGQGTSSGNITVALSGTPSIYNAWTGIVTPLCDYQQVNGATTLQLELAGNQTTILAFKSKPHGTYSQHASCRKGYSSGPSASTLAPIVLGNWSLTVESWSAPSDLYDIEGTVKTNTTYQIPALVPWNQLTVANLTYVSGRGYYSTTFSWPSHQANHHQTGAIIDLGAILHTAVLYVNGQKAPPLDVTAAAAAITSYLRTGVNTVEIVVSTPLGNALIPVSGQLRTAGVPFPGAIEAGFLGLSSFIREAEYGLVGEVVVRPY